MSTTPEPGQGNIDPDATSPDPTEPDATEPDATEPDATEPDATEPDATEPDATEPDAEKVDLAKLPETDETVEIAAAAPKAAPARISSAHTPRPMAPESAAAARPVSPTALLLRGVAVLVVFALLALSVVMYILKSNADEDKQAVQDRYSNALADLAAAKKTAEDYTARALTYDFNDSDEYVKELVEGTTTAFGESFSMDEEGAGQLLVYLQKELRVVSDAELAYSFFDGDISNPPAPGQPWNFVVLANQTTVTAQHPDKAVEVLVLHVMVVQLEGEWKIANFGPDPKTMGAAAPTPGAK